MKISIRFDIDLTRGSREEEDDYVDVDEVHGTRVERANPDDVSERAELDSRRPFGLSPLR